jgi:hypothetical protein
VIRLINYIKESILLKDCYHSAMGVVVSHPYAYSKWPKRFQKQSISKYLRSENRDGRHFVVYEVQYLTLFVIDSRTESMSFSEVAHSVSTMR